MWQRAWTLFLTVKKSPSGFMQERKAIGVHFLRSPGPHGLETVPRDLSTALGQPTAQSCCISLTLSAFPTQLSKAQNPTQICWGPRPDLSAQVGTTQGRAWPSPSLGCAGESPWCRGGAAGGHTVRGTSQDPEALLDPSAQGVGPTKMGFPNKT